MSSIINSMEQKWALLKTLNYLFILFKVRAEALKTFFKAQHKSLLCVSDIILITVFPGCNHNDILLFSQTLCKLLPQVLLNPPLCLKHYLLPSSLFSCLNLSMRLVPTMQFNAVICPPHLPRTPSQPYFTMLFVFLLLACISFQHSVLNTLLCLLFLVCIIM